MSRVIVGLGTADWMWQPVDETDLNPEIMKLIPLIQSNRISAPSLTPQTVELEKKKFQNIQNRRVFSTSI